MKMLIIQNILKNKKEYSIDPRARNSDVNSFGFLRFQTQINYVHFFSSICLVIFPYIHRRFLISITIIWTSREKRR